MHESDERTPDGPYSNTQNIDDIDDRIKVIKNNVKLLNPLR